MIKGLKLPRVVLECEDYRFVAVEIKDKNYNVTVKITNDDSDDVVCTGIITESRSTDSLGNDRWSVCNYDNAVMAYMQQQLRDGVLNVKTATKVGKGAKAKDHKVEI